jgi:hypothetical protein
VNDIISAVPGVAGEASASPPETVAPLSGHQQLSRPVQLIVAGAVAVCLSATMIHVVLVFLFVTPANTVSRLYQKQINAWVYPYFEQDWRLFAPNPQSVLQNVSARTMTTAAGGTPRPGDWVDLTAVDDAAVRHDFFPSHTAQNMLRRAWNSYDEAQGADGQLTSRRALMLQQYLRNIAVQRVTAHSHAPFSAIQLRVTTTPIPPPALAGAGGPAAEPAPTVRLLPWWQVTSLEH